MTNYTSSKKRLLVTIFGFTKIKAAARALLFLLLLSLSTSTLFAQIDPTFCNGLTADWNNFLTTYPIHGYKLDPANATRNTDDQFTQGSKDEQNISSWRWSNGSANAKGDITNAAVALTGTNNCILRFAADRTSDNGDASIGFWLFRSTVSLSSTNTFSGVHTDGDILILSDFTSGGTKPTITIYEWLNGGLVLQSSSTDRCADVNHTTQNVPTGFTYTASNGATTYAPNLFYEGAIDLCALNIPTCFAAFLVETRNSQSLDASLQDFALGSFNATPATPAATVVQPTCTVGTGTVNVTNPVSGFTYRLTGPSPATTVVTSTTGIFTNVQPGTYSLVAAQGTCLSGPSTVTVNARPPTPATPQATVTQPTCAVGTGTITVTSPLGTGITYSIGGAFQSSVTFPNVAPGTYTLTVKNSSGCTNTNTVVVNAQPGTPDRPVITIQEATVCDVARTQPTITVSCPVSGSTYILTQNNTAAQSITYNGTGSVIFTVLPGKQFSITVRNAAGCTSAATNCTNYTTNACPQAITANKLAAPAQIIAEQPTTVTAAPNPFNNRIVFSITPGISGRASLDLYNTLGQKVKTVFQGNVVKGQRQTIEYSVPNTQRQLLIYRFQVGHELISGKLLRLE